MFRYKVKKTDSWTNLNFREIQLYGSRIRGELSLNAVTTFSALSIRAQIRGSAQNVVFSGVSSLRVDEDGGTGNFKVKLNSPPSSDVVVELTTAESDKVIKFGTCASATDTKSLTFTDSNWETEQSVAICGEDDDVDNDVGDTPPRTGTIKWTTHWRCYS